MELILEKKFVAGLKKLLDKSQVENQDYIRGIVLLFLKVYTSVLKESRSDKSIAIEAILEQIEDRSGKDLRTDNVNKQSIQEYMRCYIAGYVESVSGVTVGKLYQDITTARYKKKTGQIYTPEYIIDHMISESITESRVIQNPYIRILDPSCGSGYFLVAIFKKLHAIFTLNRDVLTMENPRLIDEYDRGISNFIVENCIYGVEKDEFSSKLSKISLAIESGLVSRNILCKDMLLDRYDSKVDVVIGNPPYIGTKNLDKEYRERLRDVYHKVYEDKSDISYCFFQKANEILLAGGELNIISSRYMIEACYAKRLRRYIYSEYGIESIVDFYGENVFKGVSVSPAIFKFKKAVSSSKFKYGRVKRREGKSTADGFNSLKMFEIDRKRLSLDNWIMEPDKVYDLYNRIDISSSVRLSDLVKSSQGVITGCDKAFVIDNQDDIPESERKVLKLWIKNSGVKRYRLEEQRKYLINLEKNDIDRYPAIKTHLDAYRSQLESRRECKLGSKSWYELQWGRGRDKFTGKRLVFPYKADKNRFTLVENEVYHSADIYSIKVRDEYKDMIREEYLLAYLNSSLFEFYFKVVAKKVGASLYEYYPNQLMNLSIKLERDKNSGSKVISLVKELMLLKDRGRASKISEEIDSYFFSIYEISQEEQVLIREYIKDA